MKKLLAALVVVCALAAPAGAVEVDADYDEDNRTALAVVTPDGSWSGSESAQESRAALSLSKLYLGYWVLYNGSDEDKDLVEDMISTSNDAYAQLLDAKYPQAIDEIAADFNLESTARDGAWGMTITSAYDVATFVASILDDPVAQPLIEGMTSTPPVAEDGFRQIFGVADLDGVEGVKTGWSDDQVSATGSVAFGQTKGVTWVAAALTWGDSEENTDDALSGISVDLDVEELPELSFWTLSSDYPFPFTDVKFG